MDGETGTTLPSLPGDLLGTHRSLEPVGALPQPAWRLDNDTSHLFETEILVDVSLLNIDAASFRQMEEAAGGAHGVAARIVETVAARGKQHNPVTGSGGMLLGRVSVVGAQARHRGVVPGDRVATLASLSLTPLWLEQVLATRAQSAQLDVIGQAVIFGSAPFAKMPEDFPDNVAVALFDVAGAAPQVARLVRPGDAVLVLGAGGKSGLLCAAQARESAGPDAKIIGIETHAPYAADARSLGLYDDVIVLDARDTVAVRESVRREVGGSGEVDVAFSCVNIDGAEMAAIVCTKARGKVYFFAMSTSFSRAALGAEGIGKDVDLYIGNGFAEGHAEHTLSLVRNAPALRALFASRYA